MYLRRCLWSFLNLFLVVTPFVVLAVLAALETSEEYQGLVGLLSTLFTLAVFIQLPMVAAIGGLSAALSRRLFDAPVWASAVIAAAAPGLIAVLLGFIDSPLNPFWIVAGVVTGLTSLAVDLMHPRRMRRQEHLSAGSS